MTGFNYYPSLRVFHERKGAQEGRLYEQGRIQKQVEKFGHKGHKMGYTPD